jgi:TatD-related deoxyribonuclease
MLRRWTGPIVDHHCHLSDRPEAIDAARRFERAGGTHLFLATQRYAGAPLRSADDYRRQFETTEAIARRVEGSTGLRVYCVVAPFPPDLVDLARDVGLAEAERVHEGALRLAGQWAADHRIVALGEVGRPHFPVPPDVSAASERLFLTALTVARDAGVPAVVHSEDLDPAGYGGLATLAARAGLALPRLVKHYARHYAPPPERHGVTPSFLATRPLASASLADPGPWFWETDYLDDPARPGAVLDLATIPRRVGQLLGSGSAAVERLHIPFERSFEAVYGFTPTVPPERPA